MENKFRAWNEGSSEMWDCNKLALNRIHLSVTGHGFLTHDEDGALELLPYLIPMRFTGLHDKSGKEIYAGDVVEATIHAKTGERTSSYKRQRSTFSIYSDIQAVGVVTMDDNGYWFWKSDKTVTYNTGFWRGMGRTKSEIRANESVPTTDNLSEPLYKILKTAEVIGHIYQQPDGK